jgi:hypothetical protein
MNLTQLVSFEITDKCNRGLEHTKCPNMHPDRWSHSIGRRPMTNDQIVSVATQMYSGGFGGRVAFHFYCEPLLELQRMLTIVGRIRDSVPESKFLLWTNGDLFPDDLSPLAGIFEQIVVTNYAGRDLSRLIAICGNVSQTPVTLDWRLTPPVVKPRNEPNCLRPHLEIILDHCGNVRLCCNDWRNEVGIGNIHDEPFGVLWDRWVAIRDKLSTDPMAHDAPFRCLTCGTRYTNMSIYAPEPGHRILRHIQDRQ